ncbi:MAG TPA: hypothetical protein VF166_10525 [Gemmatimonadaceae bacterium]
MRAAAQAPDSDAARAAHALSDARKAQRSFEAMHRHLLPVVYGGLPECDVTIGRFCYWDDNRDPPLPSEPPRIARERDHLLAALADAAERAPADEWIAGQRVRYLIEAARPRDAVDVARACGGTIAWCAALRGLARHADGDDVGANAAFDTALAAMPEDERCRWTDLSQWLDGDVAKRYHKLGCAVRDSVNDRIWWLAQPLAIRAGRDVRAEFLSRQTLIRVLEHAALPEGMPWGNDMEALLVRYDRPTSWAQEDDGTLRIADPTSTPLIGHEPTPSFDVMPSQHALDDPTAAHDDDWSLTAHQALMRYAPVYADTIAPLTHQLARFRRGDSMLVVAAYDVGADTVWTRHVLHAGLVLASSPTAVDGARLAPRATTRGTFAVLVPDHAALMSLEVFAPDTRRAERARYGVASLGDSTILSDILLVASRTPVHPSLDDVLPAALGGASAPVGDTLGLYWECYARATPADPLTVRLRVVPAKHGWLHGVAHAMRLASTPTPIALEWTDVGAPDGAVGRAIRLGLRDLPPGHYAVEISVEGHALQRATTSREISIMDHQQRK